VFRFPASACAADRHTWRQSVSSRRAEPHTRYRGRGSSVDDEDPAGPLVLRAASMHAPVAALKNPHRMRPPAQPWNDRPKAV